MAPVLARCIYGQPPCSRMLPSVMGSVAPVLVIGAAGIARCFHRRMSIAATTPANAAIIMTGACCLLISSRVATWLIDCRTRERLKERATARYPPHYTRW